jgi:hypothetical protein
LNLQRAKVEAQRQAEEQVKQAEIHMPEETYGVAE